MERQGDALSSSSYPYQYDLIISLGLLDFLSDSLALKFLKLVRTKLKPGGRLSTSSLIPHWFSDYLLKNIAQIYTVYRLPEQLKNLAIRAGFTNLRLYQNKHKLLTMLIADSK